MVAAAVMTLPALFGVPQAGADPEDHVPYCSGDQTPMNNNCRPSPSQSPGGSAPGANPELPLGLTPGDQPAV
ncbi:hypothetical protein BayCH28_13630 [Mycolicibacterium sp. CH28]|uniref:hypothetical protein n=1 Tax=Mycolicibacterium sp. CH28 TaxID=2512237 RepID=UPI001081087A|nr:hypothetical protein [Mycolicibacterium sp. CH28]TGD87600.1 hypothetical protein BayCH28_13630 [Mycolicibacterium sp. CH28]